jgi:hypothetical protein
MTGGQTIPFAHCWELAKRWYPGRDGIDWQPKTPAQMQEIFDALGLTGEFWQLATPPG